MTIPIPIEIQPWYERAACLAKDADCFFPEKGGSTQPAKRICRTCRVQTECLEYALANDERFGIWGGLSERERLPLQRNRRSAGKGWRAEQTHCKEGHPLSGDNLRIDPKTKRRICKACRAAAMARFREQEAAV